MSKDVADSELIFADEPPTAPGVHLSTVPTPESPASSSAERRAKNGPKSKGTAAAAVAPSGELGVATGIEGGAGLLAEEEDLPWPWTW